MHVVLVHHRWNNIAGWIIRIITGSVYSHAAILLDGKIYDASVGNEGVSLRGTLKESFGGREVIIIPVNVNEDTLRKYIKETMGSKYDWTGVLGWMFKAQDRKKFYCYEWVWDALVECSIVYETKSRVDANDLLKLFLGATYIGKAKNM